jgi:hypothetical protein
LNPVQTKAYSKIKPELANQLYKGEKARNLIFQKQVNDLKLQLGSYGEELREANVLKKENSDYQQLILKYEEQSRIREFEYENM